MQQDLRLLSDVFHLHPLVEQLNVSSVARQADDGDMFSRGCTSSFNVGGVSMKRKVALPELTQASGLASIFD